MGSLAYALKGLFYEPITSLKLVIEGLRLFIEDLRPQKKAGIVKTGRAGRWVRSMFIAGAVVIKYWVALLS